MVFLWLATQFVDSVTILKVAKGVPVFFKADKYESHWFTTVKS